MKIILVINDYINDIKDKYELFTESNIKELDDEVKAPAEKKDIKNRENKKKLNAEKEDKSDFTNSLTNAISLESIIVFN